MCETQRGKKYSPAITVPLVQNGLAALLRDLYARRTPRQIALHQQRINDRKTLAYLYHYKSHNHLAPLRINQRR